MPVSLALFTRDLRVHDNAMLTAAATAGEVLPLFVVSRTDFAGPNRAAFLTGCLRDLARGLADRGGALVIRYGDPAAVVANLVREHDITRVHVSADASAYAHRRERALREAVGDRLVVHDDVVPAVAPTGPFEPVFTPFFQRWNEVPPRTPLPAPGGLRLPSVDPGELPLGRDLLPRHPGTRPATRRRTPRPGPAGLLGANRSAPLPRGPR
ncbi:deoxyribodipyrimidine photo-lyase [Lentzea chajnantorensis]